MQIVWFLTETEKYVVGTKKEINKNEKGKFNWLSRKKVTLKIERPLGTRHPQHGFIYMLNYGYVPDTISGDDEKLDAY